MIASKINEIFASEAVLVFKLWSHYVLFRNIKDKQKQLKSRLLFKKIANFTGRLFRNYKQFECEIYRILLKNVSDHLSVLLQFTRLYLYGSKNLLPCISLHSRSSHQSCSIKKALLKNFTVFKGKHLRQSFFFISCRH